MFSLQFPFEPCPQKISLNDSILLVGSCFSDEMGSLLQLNKFQVLSNPFGTIYNPYSIAKIITGEVKHNNLIKKDDLYFHWDSGGKVASLSKKELTDRIELLSSQTQQFISQANWIIITLGTAWVHRHLATDQIVSNCHKIPNVAFQKKILSIHSISASLTKMKSHLSAVNPDVNIIYTVSPVRHIRDGLVENNRSKARLLESVHEEVEKHENTFYFPSYEILMDELRDYRFYEEDLIHPSKQALQYIWDQFAKSYFDSRTTNFLSEWKKIQMALSHRPLAPDSKKHQIFLTKTMEKIKKLNKTVDLSAELNQIKAQIK